MQNVKEIGIKCCKYCFFNDMSNIEILYSKKIKTDENLYKNILFYYIGNMPANSVKPLYLIIKKINGYIEEKSVNKYLTLVPTDNSKITLKTYEALLSKIILLDKKYVLMSTRNNSYNYNEKYIKIRFISKKT